MIFYYRLDRFTEGLNGMSMINRRRYRKTYEKPYIIYEYT